MALVDRKRHKMKGHRFILCRFLSEDIMPGAALDPSGRKILLSWPDGRNGCGITNEKGRDKNMNQYYEELKSYMDKGVALMHAMGLFSWDNETLARPRSLEKTAKTIGILSAEYFSNLINDRVKELLNCLKDADDLTEVERAVVDKMTEDVRQLEVIPPEEYQAYSELVSRSTSVWAKAREENDFASFCPVLKEIIAYQKKFAGYMAKDGQKKYDALLDQYEKGFGMEQLDAFFGQLKKEIVPLLKQVSQKNDAIDKSMIYRTYPVDKQKEFCQFLADYIGFDMERGIIAESAHPFTIGFHNDDVRITNHFLPENVESAMFSVIHEGGHGIYEMGVSDEVSQTWVGGGASCGMHESQSRLFENIIGRSRAFWQPIYGKLQEMYPEQLGDVTLDAFYRAINKAQASLIRTEADELTYCLHIMVRYEAEKKIFEEDYPVEQLPKLWNQLYEEYLGVTPSTDTEGILQDIHWSQGSFGYFPSYALGNAFASQIYHQMEQDLDMPALLAQGNFKEIDGYLGRHIHQYGASRPSARLLKDMTGEDFNPTYYTEYLKKKYAEIYDL